MTVGINDLVITNAYGTAVGYVLDQSADAPMVHTSTAPQVSNNSSVSNPAQAGGLYDVRDSDGDKAISHVDWSQGAGQISLDAENASAVRFHSSKCIDISQPGSFRLLKDVTYTEKINTAGPIYAALGYFWLGSANGALWYSADGASWTTASITASPSIDSTISSFCSDGQSLYFCVATGSNKGIWKSTPGSSPIAFTKLGSSPTTAAIRHIAYIGGIFYAATSAGAGTVDTTTGVYTQGSPTFINETVTSIALIASGNSAYWVTAQGGKSIVYEIDFNTDIQAEQFQQFTEYPNGFIATCAVGYLSMIYVGGYYESSVADVGKGVVYVAATNRSVSAPLFELGSQPEYTQTPTSTENDNRVWAMCAAGKDLYVLTNRAAYRWDIDQGGYSHCFDFMGSGLGVQDITWNAGSNVSWDGSDNTNESPPHGPLPTAWTTTNMQATYPREINNPTFTQVGAVISSIQFEDSTIYDWSVVTDGWLFWNYFGVIKASYHFDCTVVEGAIEQGHRNWIMTPSPSITLSDLNVVGTPVLQASPTSEATWSYGAIAKMYTNSPTAALYYKATCTPSDYGETLDNSTGTTIEIVTGSEMLGVPLGLEIGDGTRKCKIVFASFAAQSSPYGPMPAKAIAIPCYYCDTHNEWEMNEPQATNSPLQYVMAEHGVAHTIRVTMKQTSVTLFVDGQEITSSNRTYPMTGDDYIIMSMYGGKTGEYLYQDTGAYYYGNEYRINILQYIMGHYATAPNGVFALDSLSLNSSAAVPSGQEIEVLSHAGIAYNKGSLMAPYAVGSDEQTFTITSSSVANPTVITKSGATTLAAAGMVTGQVVYIDGHSGSTPAIDGLYVATVTGDHTFTIPVNVSVGGTGGTATWNPSVGTVVTADTYAATGWLKQSGTTFHSGSVRKDFRYLDVAHDPLPDGSTIRAAWDIDGQSSSSTGTTSGTRTRFYINSQGYGIAPSLTITPDVALVYSPIVNGSNVIWNFVKTHRHQYVLDIRRGAADGRWQGDPETAITHVREAANQRCTFEDRFNGVYIGMIENVEFLRANYSREEGPSGIVRITVRQE